MKAAEKGRPMLIIRYHETDTGARWYMLQDVLKAIGTKTASTDAARRIRERLGEKHLSERPISSRRPNYSGLALCTDRTGAAFLAETTRCYAPNKSIVYKRFLSEPHPLDS
jgi:hypothetical protein